MGCAGSAEVAEFSVRRRPRQAAWHGSQPLSSRLGVSVQADLALRRGARPEGRSTPMPIGAAQYARLALLSRVYDGRSQLGWHARYCGSTWMDPSCAPPLSAMWFRACPESSSSRVRRCWPKLSCAMAGGRYLRDSWALSTRDLFNLCPNDDVRGPWNGLDRSIAGTVNGDRERYCSRSPSGAPSVRLL